MIPDCLHEYQVELVNNIITRPRLGLFVDMGLGKTVVTLTAINELIESNTIKKVLLIAPKAVCDNTWISEIQKWHHLKNITYSRYPMKSKKNFNNEVNIIIIHCEQLSKLIVDKNVRFKDFDMLVIDESTTFKSFKSKRFKFLKRILQYFERRLILTGTPIPNGYEDLWSQIYILDQGERLYPSITHYRNAFFRSDNLYKYKIIPAYIDTVLNNIKDIVIYKDTKEVGINLPSYKPIIKYKPLDLSLTKMYNTLEEDLFLRLDSDILSNKNVVCKTAAVLTSKLLQFSSGFVYTDGGIIQLHSNKLSLLDEILELHYDENILIVYNFKKEGEMIKSYYPEAVELNLNNISEWNTGSIKIGYFQVNTLARGVNLQHGGRILVWFGFTWALELYQQTNKRLHRQGQQKDVICYHLCSTEIERRLLKILSKKNANQQELFDFLRYNASKFIDTKVVENARTVAAG